MSSRALALLALLFAGCASSVAYRMPDGRTTITCTKASSTPITAPGPLFPLAFLAMIPDSLQKLGPYERCKTDAEQAGGVRIDH